MSTRSLLFLGATFAAFAVPAALEVEMLGPQQWCAGGQVLPSFLIIGAQKCGSTTLSNEVFEMYATQCARAEYHYFTDPSVGMHHSLGGYVERIRSIQDTPCPNPATLAAAVNSTAGPIALCYDKTPEYLAKRQAPALVKLVYGPTFPHLKLIISFRCPVKRFVSWYNHFGAEQEYWEKFYGSTPRPAKSVSAYAVKAFTRVYMCAVDKGESLQSATLYDVCSWEDGSTFNAVDQATVNPLLRGIFANQVGHWLLHISSSQLLVVALQGYAKSPAAVRNEITRFLFGRDLPTDHAKLNAEPLQKNRAEIRIPKKDDSMVLTPEAAALLASFYEPHNKRLYRVLSQHQVPIAPKMGGMEMLLD